MQDYLSDLYRKLSGQMKLGRERSEALMRGLGDPQQHFSSVHVAGTNGKGSVVALTACLLQAAGLKVGRFTSPHLVRFNERIRINGKEIEDEYVRDFLERNRELLESTEASFFEVTTALAFSYFSDNKVDAAVVETGLGGRLDATAVLMPKVTVITSIAYDHTDILGDTLEKIAGEKAGIIKKGVPLITSAQEESILNVFRHFSSDMQIVHPAAAFSEPVLTPAGMRFYMYEYGRNFGISLCGRFQMNNIAMALRAAELFLGRRLHAREIEAGFAMLEWKGRFERILTGPDVIYDVAHNPDGVQVFCDTLSEVYPQKSRTAVLGILKDKQPARVIQILAKHVDDIWLCPLHSHRSMSGEELHGLAVGHSGVRVAENVAAACDAALKTLNKDGVLAVLGSHYMAEEVYQWRNVRNG